MDEEYVLLRRVVHPQGEGFAVYETGTVGELPSYFVRWFNDDPLGAAKQFIHGNGCPLTEGEKGNYSLPAFQSKAKKAERESSLLFLVPLCPGCGEIDEEMLVVYATGNGWRFMEQKNDGIFSLDGVRKRYYLREVEGGFSTYLLGIVGEKAQRFVSYHRAQLPEEAVRLLCEGKATPTTEKQQKEWTLKQWDILLVVYRCPVCGFLREKNSKFPEKKLRPQDEINDGDEKPLSDV